MACSQSATQNTPASREPVKPGVEVLLEKHVDVLRGKRVGLITNPTAVDSHLAGTATLFLNNPDINLVALYGPEHGVRGDAQAGEFVPFYIDKDYGLPVYSLYGASEQKTETGLKNIDARMRAFDTQHTGKTVNPDILKSIDVMVFDMQDVGTRIYTYVATMAYAMQACADAGIPFVVLDRPNPIGGRLMEGPVLEYPEYSSFIGLYPIPLRHGMTIGELARLFNEKFMTKKVKLTVIPMENWKREAWFEDTALPWVKPSPNLPTMTTAEVYPGQVLLEGTNLSEGRGTTQPFEVFGAPWIDGVQLAKSLNALKLPGVIFRETWFTPTFSKFQNEKCQGAQLFVTDRNAYRPVATTLAILSVIRKEYGDKLVLHADYFDKVMGTASVREALLRGDSWQQMVAVMQPGIKEFSALRAPFLLYN